MISADLNTNSSTFGFRKCGTNNGGDRPLSNEKVIFDWTGGHSGRLLGNEDAIKLETLWQRFLAEHSKDADGITMSMIHTIR